MVAIIDYDAGNIRSVEKAVTALGKDAVITGDAGKIREAERVILPGVGAFGDAMGKIRSYGLTDVIHEVIREGKPFLAICVGLQLLFDESEESPGVKGLSVFPGKILKIPADQGLKVPQIGWNALTFPRKSRLFEGVNDGSFVYFVHSYYLHSQDPGIVTATTEYAATIHAAVEKDNVFATQFHPEKSSRVGLKILSNFLEMK